MTAGPGYRYCMYTHIMYMYIVTCTIYSPPLPGSPLTTLYCEELEIQRGITHNFNACTHIHVCSPNRPNTCTHTHECMCTYTHKHTHIHIYTYICTHVCLHIYNHTRTHAHACTFSYITPFSLQTTYVVLIHLVATDKALVLSSALEELYQEFIKYHWKGAQLLGKSHCCPDVIDEVGIPPT